MICPVYFFLVLSLFRVHLRTDFGSLGAQKYVRQHSICICRQLQRYCGKFCGICGKSENSKMLTLSFVVTGRRDGRVEN
uniref:Secreted protein n=1 Tax=Ixodes ricinus TaxID=34613 RepID=A0A6B0U5H6_IXORI